MSFTIKVKEEIIAASSKDKAELSGIPITRFFVTLFCLSTKYFIMHLNCHTAAFTHTYT